MSNDETATLATTNDDSQLVRIIEPTSLISYETIAMIQLMAPIFHQCRMYGITNEATAAAIMLKAAGLGIPVTSAFDFFDVIEGRPAMKPVGALALIHRSGIIRLEIDDKSRSDACSVTMTRRDTGYSHTVTYTSKEARESGLIKDDKPNSAWNRFRTDMLRNRAIARCARIVAPDIIGGMPLTSELEDLRSNKNYVLSSGECDHFAAIPGDVTCPTCGEVLK